jgi:hypothetical protein
MMMIRNRVTLEMKNIIDFIEIETVQSFMGKIKKIEKRQNIRR